MSALHSLSTSSTLSLQDQGPADSPFTDQRACSSGGRGAWFLLLLVLQKLIIGEKVHRIEVEEEDVEEARYSKLSGAVSGNMTFLPPLCHLYLAGRSSDSPAWHVAASRGLNKEATVEDYQLHRWTQLNDTARLTRLFGVFYKDSREHPVAQGS